MTKRTSLSHPLRLALAAAALCLVGATSLSGCETYNSPPRPSIDGLVDGVLADNAVPIVLRFSEPVEASTLNVRVIKLQTTDEGLLFDEDEDDATTIAEFFADDKSTGNVFGGTGVLSADRRSYTINLNARLPIGSGLAVVIEPGLSDAEGQTQENRLRLPFSYRLDCDTSSGTDLFPSGAYFFIADVQKPLQTQIQLLAIIDVDPATGEFVGQFTNADRKVNANLCSPPCDSTEVCRTIPTMGCVAPSTEAASENAYPDYLPNFTPPTGYSFRVEGCVAESEGGVAFINLPADVVIQQPTVTVKGIQLTASFLDDQGVLRATGSVTGEDVLIGTTPSGPASGTVRARSIPAGEVPPGIPGPQ